MYNYVFDGENGKISVIENEKELAVMKIGFHGFKAILNMIEFSDDLVKSGEDAFKVCAKFSSTICSQIKDLLVSKGINVESVLLGDLSEVRALDEYLQGLDSELSKENTAKFSNMR